MSESSTNTIDLLSHTRYREFMMQESLENLVEFSLSMSRPCPPECLRILSITRLDERGGQETFTRLHPAIGNDFR